MSDSPTLPGLAALLQTQQKAFRAEGPVSAATRKERLQSVIDMLVKHNEAAANRAQDREFLEAASEGIVALLSIDHGRAEADVQRILDLSIGAFRDDFASRAGDFITTAQKGKAVTKGAVTAAALESAGDDNAVVLVAATSQVTNVSGARDDPRPWRMSVTVSRDEDQWKMSNVEFVP